MTYVSSSASPPDGCVFCSALSLGDDRRALVLRRGTHAFLILNAYPYASGHLMAVPTRHVGTLEEAQPEELSECMLLVRLAVTALKATYRPDGFNVGLNQGRVAGAGVVGHVHIHVVPRWAGDVNFMPVIGDTKVLPETLDTSFERLSAALA
jgi:ATP adenylyltransferase